MTGNERRELLCDILVRDVMIDIMLGADTPEQLDAFHRAYHRLQMKICEEEEQNFETERRRNNAPRDR